MTVFTTLNPRTNSDDDDDDYDDRWWWYIIYFLQISAKCPYEDQFYCICMSDCTMSGVLIKVDPFTIEFVLINWCFYNVSNILTGYTLANISLKPMHICVKWM